MGLSLVTHKLIRPTDSVAQLLLTGRSAGLAWAGVAASVVANAAADFPDATTTGVPSGTALTTMGSTNITSGTNWRYDATSGFIRVEGPVEFTDMLIDSDLYNPSWWPITATRCKMPGNLAWTKVVALGPGSVLTDCELGGQANGTTYAAENGIDMPDNPDTQIQVVRCNIHHVVHGLHMNGNALLQDSYVHDMCQGQPGFTDPVAHCNPIFAANGTDMIVDHNQFYRCGNTSGGGFWQGFDVDSSIGALTYTNNLVGGVDPAGCAYGVGLDDHPGHTNVGPFVIEDNVFEAGWDAAPIWGFAANATVEGNTLADGTSISNGGSDA